MAFYDSVDIESVISVEFASAAFVVPSNQVFSQQSIEIEEDVEFADSSFVAPKSPIFTSGFVEVEEDIEYGAYKSFAIDRLPVFNESTGTSVEIIVFVLPPVGLPGSTFTQGIEIVTDFTENIFLRLEDILDILDYKGDIRLSFDEGEGKINVHQNDLERDAGLETAFLISMFTDQRATQEDIDLHGLDGLRGWWGDQFSEVSEDKVGSLLWLLERAKIDSTALSRAQDYAKKCLQWAVEDGVVKSVFVTAVRHEMEGIQITVEATRPKVDEKVVFKYFYNWKAQELRRVG